MRRPAHPGRAVLLVLLLLVGASPASAAASTWRELVREMAGRTADEQKMFAALALGELIERHEHEIGRAARGKAQGWQRGMRGYITRLEEMARLVEAGEPVRMVREAGGEVRMMVGPLQVMLATANPGGQGAYERAVVAAWCASADCAAGGAVAASPTSPALPASAALPVVEAPQALAIDATKMPTAPPTSTPLTVLAAAVPGPALAPAQAGTASPGDPPTQAAAAVRSFGTGELPPVASATALPALRLPPPVTATVPMPTVPVPVASAPEAPAPAAPAARPTVRLSPTIDAPDPASVRGNWSFGDRAPPLYSAQDGLQCAFADLRHLKLKQAACAAVMTELRELLALLRRETRDGSRVAWAQLSLRPAGAAAPALLQLAPGQRPIAFTAPYLTAAPEVLASARDWLQARLAGQPAVCRINAPEALGYLTPPTLVSAP